MRRSGTSRAVKRAPNGPHSESRQKRLDPIAAAMREANRGKVQGRTWLKALAVGDCMECRAELRRAANAERLAKEGRRDG